MQFVRLKKLIVVALLAGPVVAMADLVINLKNGKRIEVPVNTSKIKSIEFVRSPRKRNKAASKTGAEKNVATTVGRVLQVGPTRRFKSPSEAARHARDGDTVEIDAGVYPNDYAKWNQNKLTLRGVGGMAHLKSKGLIPNRKAIWILNGDDVTIENIEFSGAKVRHTNGAGIRHQGGKLTLRNTFFHDNEFSIMTGKLPGADIEIRESRFWNQKRRKRHTHGIYIGSVRSLTLIGNHFIGTDRGHQIKSRARENLIAYNRIEDPPTSNTSRLIDLSNCGFSIVLGNDLHQGMTSGNNNAIGYGPEGCGRRTEREMRLYVVNNTFVNEAKAGDFVQNFAGGDVFVHNNLIFGAGGTLNGDGQETANVRLPLTAAPADRWSPLDHTDIVDRADDLRSVENGTLLPTKVFHSPAGTRDRQVSGPLDIGARELSN